MTPPQRRRRYPKEEPAGPPIEGLLDEDPSRGGPRKEGSPQDGQDRKNPERLYLLTGGAEGGDRAALDLVTLIVARAEAPPSNAQPEKSALIRLCSAPCPWPNSRPISICPSAW